MVTVNTETFMFDVIEKYPVAVIILVVLFLFTIFCMIWGNKN